MSDNVACDCIVTIKSASWWLVSKKKYPYENRRPDWNSHLPLVSAWSGLATRGQLSASSGIPSPSSSSSHASPRLSLSTSCWSLFGTLGQLSMPSWIPSLEISELKAFGTLCLSLYLSPIAISSRLYCMARFTFPFILCCHSYMYNTFNVVEVQNWQRRSLHDHHHCPDFIPHYILGNLL